MLGASWCWAVLAAGVFAATPALAQQPGAAASTGFRAGEAFTFLFLAMGPNPIIPEFAALTAGRDRAFKLKLAFYGVAVAALGVVVAATTGVATLQAWGVSTAALALAIGTVLLILGLRAVLSVYGPQAEQAAADDDKPLPSARDLAFSPLAFPTIIPPFGVGIVVLLLSLAEERGAVQTMAVLILVVLALDLLAMLAADWIMRAPFVKFALRIVGAIMGILQVALAFQVIADAVRDLNVL